jgi:hypothetical protein
MNGENSEEGRTLTLQSLVLPKQHSSRFPSARKVKQDPVDRQVNAFDQLDAHSEWKTARVRKKKDERKSKLLELRRSFDDSLEKRDDTCLGGFFLTRSVESAKVEEGLKDL